MNLRRRLPILAAVLGRVYRGLGVVVLIIWIGYLLGVGQRVDSSPYAAALPNCPRGKESVVEYREIATKYRDFEHGQLTKTERRCDDGKERTWIVLSEYPDARTARESLDALHFENKDSDWSEARADYSVRIASRSELWECESKNNDWRMCVVSDELFAQMSRFVLTVSTSSPAEVWVPPKPLNCGPPPRDPRHELLWEQCLALSGPLVVGTSPTAANELLMINFVTTAQGMLPR